MPQPADPNPPHRRLPAWLREQRLNPGAGRVVRQLLRRASLHTVCEEARCPNLGQCFERGTATFMILGERCTRGCGFCNVEGGRPLPPDPAEPGQLAGAAAELGLRHVVVTSVTRDDLADGGAGQFAAVIAALRERLPEAAIEVLVPDFRGDLAALDRVLDAGPDVFNHNLETVPRLYPRVRPGADYRRSLGLLSHARTRPGLLVKSGLMVGLGETDDELQAVFADLAGHGVHVLTLGQYLRPRLESLAVERYVEPEAFERLRRNALDAGLAEVFAGPLVRSSYLADQVRDRALAARGSGAGGAGEPRE